MAICTVSKIIWIFAQKPSLSQSEQMQRYVCTRHQTYTVPVNRLRLCGCNGKCLHQTQDIHCAVESAPTVRMKRYMSALCTRHMYTVQLHMLRMWQVPFLCENSDFFGTVWRQSNNQPIRLEKVRQRNFYELAIRRHQILREPLESFKY